MASKKVHAKVVLNSPPEPGSYRKGFPLRYRSPPDIAAAHSAPVAYLLSSCCPLWHAEVSKTPIPPLAPSRGRDLLLASLNLCPPGTDPLLLLGCGLLVRDPDVPTHVAVVKQEGARQAGCQGPLLLITVPVRLRVWARGVRGAVLQRWRLPVAPAIHLKALASRHQPLHSS